MTVGGVKKLYYEFWRYETNPLHIYENIIETRFVLNALNSKPLIAFFILWYWGLEMWLFIKMYFIWKYIKIIYFLKIIFNISTLKVNKKIIFFKMFLKCNNKHGRFVSRGLEIKL